MGIFDSLRHAPRVKAALDFSSPNFLEMLRSGEVGNTISPETAMRISAVYACLLVLSETVSTLPCRLYKVSGEERKMQDAHTLHHLVHDAPNDWMTASEYWKWNVLNIGLEGNSYSYKVRTEGKSPRVVSLLPIVPSRCSPQVMNGRLVNYQITLGDGKSERVINVPPRDMLHFKGLSLDGLRGVSPIRYNSAMLEQTANARDFAGKVFTNGATPRGILTTDGEISDDAYKNIKESWAQAHGGVSNSNKVAILEAGLRFEKISMSPDDVQLLDTRKLGRAEIAGMYRVPPHMIADLDRSTFNNIEHQTLDFYKSSIAPWLVNFQQRLNLGLTPGDRNLQFEFDVTELIRGDLKSEVESYEKLYNMRALNPNEIRRRIGYNPYTGGEKYAEVKKPAATEPKEPKEPIDEPDS